MADTARTLKPASARRRQAQSADEERALDLHVASSPAFPSEGASARTTLDSTLIARWKALPPHVRQGYIGMALASLGVAGYAGLVARGDAHSPLAAMGQLWHAFAGEGAYALAILLVAGGSVRLAERFARRPLVRPALFALALALWLTFEVTLQVFFGRPSGGAVGALLALPLARLPGLVRRALPLLVAVALGMALAGIGPRDAWRSARRLVRRPPPRILQRGGALVRRGPADWLRSIKLRQASGDIGHPETRLTSFNAEPPTALVLPTAGFPSHATAAVQWELPPADLFDAPAQPRLPAPGLVDAAVGHVRQTLARLGLAAEVRREDVSIGPAIVRLGIQPVDRPRRDARGYLLVSRDGQPLMERAPLSSILQAQRELSAALGLPRLRMEAPAPGQTCVTIELPRFDAQPVTLHEILLSDAYQRAARTGPALALGRDARGAALALGLAGESHLLVAGLASPHVSAAPATLVASLLAGATPDDVRVLLLDGPQATLVVFDDVPHLLLPVARSQGAQLNALRRVLEETERRGQVLARLGISDLAAYRRLAAQDGSLEWLPALVVVVAELTGLLASSPWTEQMLCQAARRGQLTGIHLVLATEHPEPAAIPAALRALMPVRLAFAVGSQAQSRAILDRAGAECLVPHGDALVRRGDTGQLIRMQAVTLSVEEAARLARFWRRQGTTPTRQPATPTATRTARPVGTVQADDAQMAGSAAPAVPPPLRRAPQPAAATTRRGGHSTRDEDDLWQYPLPEGWTDEMIEDMVKQLRSAIAHGRAPRASRSSRSIAAPGEWEWEV